MSEKILLDTDIGSDIDDAVCLAYLLSHPECELLGITTVSGEALNRAMLASAICKVAKKNISIYPGVEAPLLVEQKQPNATQAKALERWEHDTDFPQGEAIEFMRKTIRKYPGEVTLLAIGPMTNIALLFSIDPEIPSLLKGLVLMCGIFTNSIAGAGPLEWNAVCDPHAAAIVYNAPVKIHRSIGLDVTCQVTLSKEEVREKFKSELLKPVADFAGVFFENTEKMTFHDPLAAATIFDHEICNFVKGNVEIELTSDKLMGLTHWKQDTAGVHEVALSVDKDRFLNHYFTLVNKYGNIKMPKITVIGSLNMDLVVTSPKIPVIGETVLGSGFITVPGGKGANQAVAAAKLVGDVTMIGCIGNDIFGKKLLENLELNKVNISYIRIVEGYSTGTAMIVVCGGDNFIIVDPGANSCVVPEDIITLEGVISQSNMVVVQLEIPIETVEKTIEIAKKHKVKVLLNPAPARKLSDELLSKVDIFTPNETECQIITGLSVQNVEEAKTAVAYLNKKGIETVLITLGGKGVVYNNKTQIVHKTVPKVNVVDTTAAGDSFSGALTVALTNGMDIDSAVDFANVVGTLTVTKKGAQSSLPCLTEVENFIKNRCI